MFLQQLIFTRACLSVSDARGSSFQFVPVSPVVKTFRNFVNPSDTVSVQGHNVDEGNVRVHFTRWFKYDRDDLCVNKSQFVPVIFEPPCTCFHSSCALHKLVLIFSCDLNTLLSAETFRFSQCSFWLSSDEDLRYLRSKLSVIRSNVLLLSVTLNTSTTTPTNKQTKKQKTNTHTSMKICSRDVNLTHSYVLTSWLEKNDKLY
jgi:hypothetical protein